MRKESYRYGIAPSCFPEVDKMVSDNRATFLRAIIDDCCQRYLDAAELLEVKDSTLTGIHDFIVGRINVSPLLEFYYIICNRIIHEVMSPQLEFGIIPEEYYKNRWVEYYCWEVCPSLVKKNSFVKAVLTIMGLLPNTNPIDATSDLAHLAWDISLPEMLPFWLNDEHSELSLAMKRKGYNRLVLLLV